MKKIIILLLALVVIAGLFFALKPTPDARPVESTATQTETEPEQKPQSYTVKIEGGEVIEGNKILTATQNDEITIMITNDTNDELHLHGYDKEVSLTAGQPSELKFRADVSGRFEAELHESEKVVFVIEVQPAG